MTLRSARHPSRVLLVDDDRDLLDTLAGGLQSLGFEVFTAGTAEEAIDWARSADRPADVVVLDILLPDSWGAQVALEFSAFSPSPRFIFMSGHARDDAVLAAGAELDEIPFLEKPFKVRDLVRMIDSAVTDEAGEEERD